MRFLVSPNPAGIFLDAQNHRLSVTPLGPNAKASGPAVHEADTEDALMTAMQLTRMAPVVSAPTRRTWPALDFFLRFTDTERHAVYAAANQSPQIQDFVTLGSAAGQVHSDNPTLLAALAAFVQLGILTAQRRDAILGN